jgi:hypothetical protein
MCRLFLLGSARCASLLKRIQYRSIAASKKNAALQLSQMRDLFAGGVRNIPASEISANSGRGRGGCLAAVQRFLIAVRAAVNGRDRSR